MHDSALFVVRTLRRPLLTAGSRRTLTEWGDKRGSREAVESLNDSLASEAQARDIEVIDIGPVSDRGELDDTLLVQSDPPVPYPTAKQYAGWAEVIGPYVYDALRSIEP